MEDLDQVALINSIQDTFFQQSSAERIQTLSLIVWLFGGILNDPYVYLIGIIGSVLSYIITVVQELFKRQTLEVVTIGLKSKLVIGGLAHMFYFEWGRVGQDHLSIFSFDVAIVHASIGTIGFFFATWISARSFDTKKWLTKLDGMSYLFLLVSGIMKLALWLYVLTSIFGIPFSEDYLPMGIFAALAEPFLSYLFHRRNMTLSTFDMAISDLKFPEVAARDASIVNIFYLSIAIYWGDLYLEEAQLVRAGLVLMVLFFFIQGHSVLQRFARDPLMFSPHGRLITETPDLLEQFDPKTAVGSIIKRTENFLLNSTTAIELKEDSVIIPLKEDKDQMEIAIVGKFDTIQKGSAIPIIETLEGITSINIPKNIFHEISKKYQMVDLSKIDFSSLGLPDIETIKELLTIQSVKLKGWLNIVREDLNKFISGDLSIHSEDGFTSVNLGLIQVIEHEATDDLPQLTRVKLPGISVLETDEGTLVRLFGYTIFDHPRFNFVSLPGLTVLDFGDDGTLVNLMGMKIGDQIPPSKLDEAKELLSSAINEFERKFDSGIGRLLSRKDTMPMFNISFEGEFHPMFSTPSNNIVDLALPGQRKKELKPVSEPNLLPEADYEIIEDNEKNK